MALLGLWQAQSASATDSKLTVSKVNEGGNAADTFGFAPDLVLLNGDHVTASFALAGGQSKDFTVLCNDKSTDPACGTHALTFTEQPTAGYDLKSVVCTKTAGLSQRPGPNDPAANVTVTGSTVSIKAQFNEWVACVFTNKPTPVTPPGTTPPGTTPPGTTPPATTPPGTPPLAPTPQVTVKPARAVSGTARLRGPSGCLIRRAVAASVRGRAIARVVFSVDGRRVATVTRPRNGAYSLSVDMGKVRPGAHRVTARVQFKRSAATRAKTLRTRFLRCKAARVSPSFTG